jgi:hypothetical protein
MKKFFSGQERETFPNTEEVFKPALEIAINTIGDE